MKNYTKLGFSVGIIFFAFVTYAQMNPFDLEFPIPELGNCNSFDECKFHCDNPKNQSACMTWAKSKGFTDKPESHVDEHKPGPGGCVNQRECESYCDGPEHAEECLNFAVSEGFMSEEEASRIREEMNKTGPGGCKSHEECDAFCRNPDNSATCLQFSVDEGMLTQKEADFMLEREQTRRMEGPGGPDIDETKVQEMFDQGVARPGGCATMAECDEFCSQPGNGEICFNFAKEHGLMKPDEIITMEREMEIMKKLDSGDIGGPGGCRSREECDTFCQNPDNMETCMNFAGDQGMRDKGEIESMKIQMRNIESTISPPDRMYEEIKNNLGSMPPELKECVVSALGQSVFDELEMSGSGFTSEDKDRIKRAVMECVGAQSGMPSLDFNDEMYEQMRVGLESASQSMKECVRTTMGQSTYDKFRSGNFNFSSEEKEKIQWAGMGCAEVKTIPARSMPAPDGVSPQGRSEPPGGFESVRGQMDNEMYERMRSSLGSFPPKYKECAVSTMGQSVYNRLEAGDFNFTLEEQERMYRVGVTCVMDGTSKTPYELFESSAPTMSVQPERVPEAPSVEGMTTEQQMQSISPVPPMPTENEPTSALNLILGTVLSPLIELFQ